MTNYRKFEIAAIKDFRKLYADYKNVKTKDLQICEDGNIYIGCMQFPINIKLSNF